MQPPNSSYSTQSTNKIVESVYLPTSDKKAELEQELYTNESLRGDKKKEAVHSILIVFLWFAFGMAVLTIIIRISHLLLPVKYRWLCDTDIQTVDKILFSGTIGGFIGSNIKKVFEEEKA
jgi:hypothetical protein